MNPANRAAPAAPAGGNPQQQQPQRPSIMKMILTYMAINYIFGFFFKGNQQATPMSHVRNVFDDNEPLEFKMFLSNSEGMDVTEDTNPIWHETGLEYNYNKENYRELVVDINVEELFANSSNSSNPELYAHFIMKSTRSPNTINYTHYEPFLMQDAVINLIEWRNKDLSGDQENLLFGAEDGSTKVEKNKTSKDEKFPHLKQKIWIQLVHDTNAYPINAIPPQLGLQVNRTEAENIIYLPILDTKQFWLRKKDFALLDPQDTNITLNITFSFNTYWIYKYMMESQFRQTGGIYEEWGVGDGNMDEMKEMVLDANPILFGVTVVVSLLHSLFEFLALKNDIVFWKNLESHKGLSLRTLWVSLVTEIVVLLYLLDNDTSFLILISSFAELGVTIWKILKTTKWKKREDGKFPFYEIDYQDAYKSTTMEYDQAAGKYLIWILIPLLSGYTIYSLIYEKHKGWYSFVLQTLVGFIYVFGFIQMTPQLYINYKLKSVEHLPWRVLIYKFLNTIVDDLFAFVITMPWLKRLSCFRDDIIFIIYVYQRWIYRVDKNRDPYGNIKKEEETPKVEEQKKIEAQPSTDKKKGPKETTVSTAKKDGAGNAAEEEGVTHRNVQEVNEEASPTQPQPEVKGPKMKKKKVA